MRAADRLLRGAAGRMTRGQRWTAALALVLATCVLVFGLPVHTTFVPGTSPPRPAAAAPETRPTPVPSPVSPPPVGPAPIAVEASPIAGPAPSPAVPAPVSQPTIMTPPPRPLTVVVLAGGNPTGVPGRDDATIAAAFFEGSGLRSTTVDDSGDPMAACHAAQAAGNVAVASQDIPTPLRRCLLAAGVTLLAFDETGTAGRLFSTRRGDTAVLADLARWGRASHQLDGRIGLIADGDRRSDLEPGVAAMRAGGEHVVAVAWLSGALNDSQQVAQSVEDFERAGVEDVVFAAPVQTQQRWAAAAAALGARFHEVVSDVDDAVVDETYPAVFDGALARTSLRIPWYARDHGPTPAQQQCADRWTAVARPAVVLAQEQETVYAWCEEVAALRAAGSPDRLRGVRINSPLTSDIGALQGGDWGPGEDATLVWHAACECWQQSVPFGPGP